MHLTNGMNITLDTPMDHINVHLYGGNIIPTQEPALTTSERWLGSSQNSNLYYMNQCNFSRKNPFGLIVAIDSNSQASGSLFWDDGSSIDTISEMKFNIIDFEYQNVCNIFVWLVGLAEPDCSLFDCISELLANLDLHRPIIVSNSYVVVFLKYCMIVWVWLKCPSLIHSGCSTNHWNNHNHPCSRYWSVCRESEEACLALEAIALKPKPVLLHLST